MALSRNGCVMPRELCEIISKNWIFPDPFCAEPFDANVEGKKASFREAGIEYTIKQIDEYRACGINGIHLYALTSTTMLLTSPRKPVCWTSFDFPG